VILAKKFERPKSIGESRRILVIVISSGKSFLSIPLKMCGAMYGTKIKAIALTAIIRRKKKEKILLNLELALKKKNFGMHNIGEF